MILLPFIFFITLTYLWWRKHQGFDVCVYMTSLYVLISLLAIVISITELMGDGGILFENDNAVFGFAPTILFCFCIGLSLLPFSIIYSKELKIITINAPWAIDLLTWMLIAVSFLNLYLVADSTLDILQGDLAQIRRDHYAGIESPGLTSCPAIGEMVCEIIKAKINPKKKENAIIKRKAVKHTAGLSVEELNALIKENSAYGNIICRCEAVTEGEIIDAIHRPLGAKTLDGVKRRTRAGMGRCQAGFCMPRTMEILSRELGVEYEDITKSGGNSNIVLGRTKGEVRKS